MENTLPIRAWEMMESDEDQAEICMSKSKSLIEMVIVEKEMICILMSKYPWCRWSWEV